MRVRLLSLLSAAALVALTAIPVSARAASHEYLALGDSVAFGFSRLLFNEGLAGDQSLFVGYPTTVAKTMNLNVVNPSCPGETSGGFISRTPALDFMCLPYVGNFPLHVQYSGSQLQFAIHYLETHPTVRLVTMDIGANDVFKLQTSCDGSTTNSCFLSQITAVLTAIGENLRFIYGELRNVAHYHHALVTLTYYSIFYDTANATATQALNAPIIDATKAFGGIVASGFDAFQGPALQTPDSSSCEAGLLIVLPPPLPCDVHPTPSGRDLLAGAIVNAVADSCPARSFNGCLDRNED